MRLVVTGRDGQVSTALAQAEAARGVEVVRLGRPELDLERPETIAPALRAARPDIVISAAAYTAVDQAEREPERARQVNAVAPGVLAQAAARLQVPIVHLSTDYVFDGAKPTPYVETDPTDPVTVYGATKLEGERAVAAAQPRHVILRTAWVYAPYGRNFVRTLLRMAQTQGEIDVVADQRGCPTYAPDIAEGVMLIARALLDGEGGYGVHHMAGGGETNWAAFATAVFEGAAGRGGAAAHVKPIASADYPTLAKRPANSRLDCSRLRAAYGVALPEWPSSLERCLDLLLRRKTGSERA